MSSQGKITKTTIEWIKAPWYDKFSLSSLRNSFPGPAITTPSPPDDLAIRTRIKRTGRLGYLPLWEGYGEAAGMRASYMVSSQLAVSRFFTELTKMVRPKIIVEFGTAFGVSGMHWLSGLKQNKQGHLYTYEVNQEWAAIARKNLEAISPRRFTLTAKTFEDSVDVTLKNKKISIAFIDGIHKPEWVFPQYELIRARLEKGGIIILDDINFTDDMRACWDTLVRTSGARYAATINNGRIGLLHF